jgi:hypothetical protein
MIDMISDEFSDEFDKLLDLWQMKNC